MAVIIASDANGLELKTSIVVYLKEKGHEVVDLSFQKELDIVDVTLKVTQYLTEHPDDLAIIVDDYGVTSFMAASKIKGMIVAEASDERTAYMTRGHNNSRIITLGAELVGHGLGKKIAEGFVTGTYDGGRHQIRVDMLNKMC